MSPLLRRRLRGFAGTMLTWAAGGALFGVLAAGALSLAVLLPRGYAEHVGDLTLGLGIAGGIAGAISGAGFALLLLCSERRRTFAELRSWRVGACGAAASAAMGWLISRDPGFALVCSTIGLGAATSSLAIARRALEPPHDALLGAGALEALELTSGALARSRG